ncbi:MAG TPA: hypothetical protein VGT44_11640, partial [Ktedonobacteraceae bacterium]|nr:hypothetical protein [Ktedonobacteraceae bacterium]
EGGGGCACGGTTHPRASAIKKTAAQIVGMPRGRGRPQGSPPHGVETLAVALELAQQCYPHRPFIAV